MSNRTKVTSVPYFNFELYEHHGWKTLLEGFFENSACFEKALDELALQNYEASSKYDWQLPDDEKLDEGYKLLFCDRGGHEGETQRIIIEPNISIDFLDKEGSTHTIEWNDEELPTLEEIESLVAESLDGEELPEDGITNTQIENIIFDEIEKIKEAKYE